jgi:predicted dehydrogenase
MSEPQKRRFLVFGSGSIGRRHAANLLALQAGEVMAFDPLPQRRAELTAQTGIACVESMEAAWAWKPEVALITSPTSLHLPLALEAAQHGCHLFIEKPLADKLDGLAELENLVKTKRLVSLIGCNMRFHPGLQRAKQLLAAGTIGKVCTIQAEFGQYLPDWRPQDDYRKSYSARRELGGGVILDVIHELDYLRWLAGEVTAIHAFADHISHLEINTEDVAAILLRFANGAIGTANLDYVQRAYHRTCRIVGEQGTITWDYAAGKVTWFTASTKTWQEEPNPAGWVPNQMYVDELKHFLACLDGQATSTNDVAEARRVLQIALAAHDSSRTGKNITWPSP